MRIYDITIPLSEELPVYPGDFPVVIAPWTSIADGDSANIARITICSHSGTHIDSPRHFVEGGLTVDQIPMERLIGKAKVVEIAGVAEIGQRELERLPVRGVERLLLKTANAGLWKDRSFKDSFVALAQDGADYLVEIGVKMVGIDYLSIERSDGDGGVHRVLLEHDVLIVEGLNLVDVPPGDYELICLPLKVKNGDGAPVRAILRGGADHPGQEFDPHSTKWPLS
ncbi:cyclase family protein [Geomonas sp. Red32]|uniref:cyclase family protein n=1 Tax=Geomonas sp. Red32 TaxID=2912856 RepID=UPI00202CF431|nr:cyclase family protein [Geomonas sp. Red32]MCM0083972.1 cyclase family protein [Geomonas sp. Red32]